MKELAAFEAGIKLGALFHQFVGVPVSLENAEILEKAMKSCILLQPYVVDADVRIDRKRVLEKLSRFNYCSLEGDMIFAKVEVEVNGFRATGVLEWDEERKYPLMKLITE